MISNANYILVPYLQHADHIQCTASWSKRPEENKKRKVFPRAAAATLGS